MFVWILTAKICFASINVPFTFVVAVVLNMIVCHGITVLVICLMFGCFAFRLAVNYCKNGLGQSEPIDCKMVAENCQPMPNRHVLGALRARLTID